jgi:hypothetical protein
VAVKASIDTRGFCTGPNAYVVGAWAATTRDVWATCEHRQSTSDVTYLYATTDGGLTWRPFMGAPTPQS